MATLSALPNAFPLREPESGKLTADMSPGHLAASPQDQDQFMQEPRQMVTNLALSQGWSFAAVTADAESSESASSGTAQPLPQQDGDVVVLPKSQEPDPKVPGPDTAGSETSKTESPAQGSAVTDTTAGTPSSKNIRTLLSENETSEDDGGDMLAAIRKAKNKGLRTSQPAAQPASSVPPGMPAADTPLNPVENGPEELPSFDDSANKGTKDPPMPWVPGTIGSRFLVQYNYTGNKRPDPETIKKPKTAKKSRKKEADDTAPNPKHSRKRPTPEVIDLTEAPDEPDNPPLRHEGKRRKLDENGREKKRHKSQRAESQANDDAREERKRSSSEKRRVDSLFGDNSVTRSSVSRKTKESSRRERHRERREARKKEKDKARRGSVLDVQPVLEQHVPQAPSQNTGHKQLQSVQQWSGQQPLPKTHPQPRQERLPEPPQEPRRHPRQDTSQLHQELSQPLLEPRKPPHLLSQLGQGSLQASLWGSTQARGQGLRQGLSLEPQTKPRPQQTQSQGSQLNQNNGVTHDAIDEARRRNAEIINAKKNRPATAGHNASTGLGENRSQTTQTNGSILSAVNSQDDVGLFNGLMSKVPEKRTAQVISSLPNGHSGRNGFPAASRRVERPALSQPGSQLPHPHLAPAARINPLPYVPPGPAAGRGRQTSQLAQSRNIFQPKPRPQPRYNPQPRTDIPLNQTIISPPPPAFPRPSLSDPQPQPSNYVPLPLRHAPQQQQQPQYQTHALQPPYHANHPPQPAPPPRESISALEALGPDRTVIQYVVYRTPRFTPPTRNSTSTATAAERLQPEDEDENEGGDDDKRLLQQIKQSKAIRCSEHFSLPAANAQAAGLQERPRKGVVGKGWGMAASVFSSSSTSSTSHAVGGGREGSNSNPESTAAQAAETQTQPQGVQLYQGNVTFSNGEVQYFWVGEETRDMGGPVAGVAARDIPKAGGFCGMRVDKAGVAIYTRKRFDVWSRVWFGKEVRGKARGGGGQRVVFECGGEDGGEGGGAKEGVKEGVDGDGKGDEEVLIEDLSEQTNERTGDEEGNGEDESGDDEENEETNGDGNGDGNEVKKVVSNGDRNADSGEVGNEEIKGNGNEDDTGPGTDVGRGEEDKNKTTADEQATSNPQPEPTETQNELPAKEEEEEEEKKEDEDQTSDETPDADNTRTRRSHSVSSTATLAFPSHANTLDLVTITSNLHGTYTTLSLANRAALSTFFALAKPKNSAMEDNHHYRYEVKPGMTALFEEGGYGQQDCATLAVFEWDPPAGRPYRWGFLRLEVEVVESELVGPVDIGDMVVEGGEGGENVNGGGHSGEANRAGKEKGGNAEVEGAEQAATLPGSVEESEGEVSEEE